MYLEHKLSVKIARILEIADKTALLMDENGNVLIPEDDSRVFNLPEQIKADPTTPLVYGGVTLIGTAAERPLLICLHGDSEDVKKCARLCAELVGRVLNDEQRQSGAEQSLRLLLEGDAETDEPEILSIECGLNVQQERCVIVFRFEEMEAETILRILSADKDRDEDTFVIMGRHTLAVIKCLSDDAAYEEAEQYALAVAESFLSEYGLNVYAGISAPCGHIAELHGAYIQARTAIDIGSIFHVEKHVYTHQRLLLERFLTEVPSELCLTYNKAVFNRQSAKLFNDEMLRTIEAFFNNSLNLSETARRLYIHRNTLVYRLEKIRRVTGLDLRNFDDAVTFKLMMMMGKKDADRNDRY